MAMETEAVWSLGEEETLEAMRGAFPLALSLTRCHDAAHDLVMDALLRCVTCGQRKPGKALLPYLRMAVRNRYIDLYRTRQRAVMLSLDAPIDGQEAEIAGEILSPHPTPEEAYLAGEERARVGEAMASIAPQYREALELYAVHDLSYEEIARLTCTNLGTVRSRINRGRHRVRLAYLALTQ
jgi:RNA polymerase sigma-70 factor (ECF subfamily)